MSSLFKYDLITLIKLVEQRPCIWDRTTDGYKDRILKQKSWEEIFSSLEEGYEDLSEKEKDEIGDSIISKWQNLRDAFLRSMRNRAEFKAVKPYLYHQYIKFLLKCQDDRETNTHSDTKFNIDAETQKRTRQISPNVIRRNKKRITDEIIEEKRPILKSQRTNEDDAFFISISHSVNTMSEDEKLQFRVEVLSLIQRIKQRRCTSGSATSNLNNTHFFDISSIKEQPTQEDSNMMYAQYMANKLGQFQGRTRALVERDINELIFDAEMGKYEYVSPATSSNFFSETVFGQSSLVNPLSTTEAKPTSSSNSTHSS